MAGGKRMANQEQLDRLLKQGVEAWNKWRADNPFLEIGQSNLDLTFADLHDVDLHGANLSGADLSDAIIFTTVFGDVDLSTVKGLETVQHDGPSTIGIDTIIRSQGKIPEVFLKGAGVPPSIIEAIPSLVGSLKPIDFYSCFISYSSKDQDFAERLYADLQAKGVGCWLDKEDLKIGEKFRPRIDEAIGRHDKLVLVLSQHSVRSSWVETEIETAFEKEHRYKKLVLLPNRLDEVVMRTRQAWAADIRKT
jgi:TIR domain/Pentapeptide repeats (8 copies)